jgi:hypothetical protein
MFAQRKLGFTAIVLTDHIYMDDYQFSMTLDKFIAQCREAGELEQKYAVPFIIGAEVSTMRLEECNIFGLDAIVEVFKRRGKGILTKQDLVEIKTNFDCVINMNHPMNPREFVQQGCMEFLDGVEYIHCREKTFDSTFKMPEEFKTLCHLCNSDAHHIDALQWCWNETDVPITTEKELISYMKNRGQFKHHVTDPMKFLRNLK